MGQINFTKLIGLSYTLHKNLRVQPTECSKKESSQQFIYKCCWHPRFEVQIGGSLSAKIFSKS